MSHESYRQFRLRLVKESYIRKIFFSMMILLIAASCFIGAMITGYSKKVIGEELIKLNQATLNQTVKRTAWMVNDAVSLCNTLAYDSYIIDGLLTQGLNLAKRDELNLYIEKRVTDNAWMNYHRGRTFQVSVYGNHEYRYKEQGNWNYEKAEEFFRTQSEMENREAILIGSYFDEDTQGIYRYTFQIMQEVKDLLTKESQGYVVVSVSETALCETYRELATKEKKFRIVDQNGIIVSSKDKREIGKFYIKNEGFTGNREEGSLISYTDTQKPLYLYSRIGGTPWYLMEQMEAKAVWKSLNQAKMFTVVSILGFIAVLLCISYHYARKTMTPVTEIQNKMGLVTKGDFSVRAQVNGRDEFGQIAESFNYMVEKMEDMVQEIREVEKKKRLAELDFLRVQINPHFIYNTLSSIRFYVEMGKQDEAESMLLSFSKLLRKTLSRSDELISLKDEMETIKNYVELQKHRYKDQFQIQYVMEEDTCQCLIPTFIVQPIVENAIFYSIKDEKISQIMITSRIQEDVLRISVQDNGIGMSQDKIYEALQKEAAVNKVGLKNVQERIQLIYGIQYGIEISSESGSGTTVTMKLPVDRKVWIKEGIKDAENIDC